MREAMELKVTPSVWLNVGKLHDQTFDKRVALERARRGVEAMGLEWGTIIARDRRGHVADTRHMVSKYLRDCGFSFPEIANALQRSNHTTSVYSVRRCNELIDMEYGYRKNYHKFLNA
jgi:chromosomal replication initiation ATPase DnaA